MVGESGKNGWTTLVKRPPEDLSLEQTLDEFILKWTNKISSAGRPKGVENTPPEEIIAVLEEAKRYMQDVKSGAHFGINTSHLRPLIGGDLRESIENSVIAQSAVVRGGRIRRDLKEKGVSEAISDNIVQGFLAAIDKAFPGANILGSGRES